MDCASAVAIRRRARWKEKWWITCYLLEGAEQATRYDELTIGKGDHRVLHYILIQAVKPLLRVDIGVLSLNFAFDSSPRRGSTSGTRAVVCLGTCRANQPGPYANRLIRREVLWMTAVKEMRLALTRVNGDRWT